MPAPDKIEQLVQTFEQNLSEFYEKTLQEKESVQRQVETCGGWGD